MLASSIYSFCLQHEVETLGNCTRILFNPRRTFGGLNYFRICSQVILAAPIVIPGLTGCLSISNAFS